MSKEGTEELLSAIDPLYDTVNAVGVVDESLPSDRYRAFRKGYNTLKRKGTQYSDRTKKSLRRVGRRITNTFSRKKNSSQPTNMVQGAEERLSSSLRQPELRRIPNRRRLEVPATEPVAIGGSLKRLRNRTVKRTFNIVRNYQE